MTAWADFVVQNSIDQVVSFNLEKFATYCLLIPQRQTCVLIHVEIVFISLEQDICSDLMLPGDRLMAQRPEAQAFVRHVAQLARPAEFLPGRSSHTIRLFREVQLTHLALLSSSLNIIQVLPLLC